jgi:hypothetical protein
MGKLVAVFAILGVAGLMGGLFLFLQWQDRQTHARLAAAADWLMERNERLPIADGWKVDVVQPREHGVEIHMVVPEDQAATLLGKPPLNRRASLGPGCPTPEEAIWGMLPGGAIISVAAVSASGKPVANAVCSGPS